MARKNEVRYVNFYTPGSAAYKFEPDPIKKKVTLPKPRRKKKILIPLDPAAALGVVVVAVLLIMMVVGLVQLGTVQRETAQMQEYVTQLRQENDALEAQYHAGYDPEEIRQIAEAMGMIPIEQAPKVYITVPPVETEEPSVWQQFCTFLTDLFA